MKGLILKDLYVTVSAFRSLVLILLVFCGVGIAVPGTAFYIPYIAAIPGTLASSMIQIEERERWNCFAACLPVTRRQMITAKYLYALIMVCGGAVLATLVYLIQALRTDSSVEIFPVFLQCMAIGLVLPAVNLPINVIFGTVKTRYVNMLLIVVLVVVAMNNATSEMGNVLGIFDRIPFVGILAACLLLFAASWALTSAVFAKKEIGNT